MKTEPVKAESTSNNIAVVNPVDSSLSYYALLEQGDKEIKLQNYEAATISFNKAHTLRPDDKFPLQRLEEIKVKSAEKNKLKQQENSKTYTTLIAEAFNYLDKKQYTEAQQAYQRSLELKPGDAFASSQLQTLNNFY